MMPRSSRQLNADELLRPRVRNARFELAEHAAREAMTANVCSAVVSYSSEHSLQRCRAPGAGYVDVVNTTPSPSTADVANAPLDHRLLWFNMRTPSLASRLPGPAFGQSGSSRQETRRTQWFQTTVAELSATILVC